MGSANEKATRAWVRHELVTKAIFEALLRLDDVKNLEIKHNIRRFQGRTTTHQIDVFWKFEAGGLEHLAIVEVKKRKGRAGKGSLLRFQAVLSDIPGQPRGIFVTESGYQRGALEVAQAHGIAAYEIRELDRNASRPRIQLTVFSTIAASLKLDRMMVEGVIFIPTIIDLNLTLDEQWMAQHPEAMPASRGNEPTLALHVLQFLDEFGVERTNFRTLVQDRARDSGNGGRVLLEVEFPEPTYLSGLSRLNKDGHQVGNLKVLRLAATLDIKTRPMTIPAFSAATATYLFKKAMEKDERYVLVAENGTDIDASEEGQVDA